MPMSPRTLRPRNALHPEAVNWAARVVANGGTVGTSLPAVNRFCRAIDAAGIRDKFFRLNLFCGSNLNAALVPLYRGPSLGGTQYGSTVDINTGLFVSADYSETLGLLGNGTSKYLDTGFLPAAASMTTGSVHLSAVLPTFTQPATSNTFPIAMLNNAQNERHWINCNSNTIPTTEVSASLGAGGASSAINTIAAANGGVSIPGGLWMASRTANNDLKLWLGSTQRAADTTNISSYGFATNAMTVFVRNGSGLYGYFGQRMMGYSAGLGMNSTQVAAFNTAVTNFNAAMGRTV